MVVGRCNIVFIFGGLEISYFECFDQLERGLYHAVEVDIRLPFRMV